MKRLKLLVAGTLLVMWLPATSFCLAEGAGMISSGSCCDESSSTGTPLCCALGSAVYKLDDNSSLIVSWFGAPLVFITTDFNPPKAVSVELVAVTRLRNFEIVGIFVFAQRQARARL